MNDNTVQLLQGLADKLGTTSEYLWSILLKQAPVFAWITTAQYVATLLLLIVLWRYRKPISNAIKVMVEETEIFGVILVGIGIVCLTLWLIACVCVFESVVTAFVNPEYWALDKVLATVKAKK